VLLRSAYLRSGYELPPDPGQIRFFESAAQFIENMEALAAINDVRVGVAPHSLRAVPLRELKEIAAWTRERKLPLHIARGRAGCGESGLLTGIWVDSGGAVGEGRSAGP